MSRKMSAYARQKVREQSKPGAKSEALMQKVCGLEFMVARSKPFRDNPIFNPDSILLPVRLALQGLLDRTMVLYGSNMGEANIHDNTNLPIILAGGGFKHGQHIAFNREHNTPLSNLFVTMLHYCCNN